MKNIIKSFLKIFISIYSSTRIGTIINDLILKNIMNQVSTVTHEEIQLKFATPNWVTRWRAETFSIKEPETLEWIDSFPKNSVLWDIGANVGVYSCYAAKKHIKVFAFEPSTFNLELLSRNIFLNNLTEKITIVPLPLSDQISFNTLNMTSTEWGGALSTFGKEYGHDGKHMDMVFKLPTIGLSMVDALNFFNIQQPNYIKMDVDGIEHLILKGGQSILKKASQVLVEINDSFNEQFNLSKSILIDSGFSLIKKGHHEDSYTTSGEGSTYNQIWTNTNIH